MNKIKVSNKELELIQEAIKNYDKDIIYKVKPQYNKLYITGSEDFFIHCREACLDLLDYKGFDENYDLTPDGKILEGLIDRIYNLIQ